MEKKKKLSTILGIFISGSPLLAILFLYICGFVYLINQRKMMPDLITARILGVYGMFILMVFGFSLWMIIFLIGTKMQWKGMKLVSIIWMSLIWFIGGIVLGLVLLFGGFYPGAIICVIVALIFLGLGIWEIILINQVDKEMKRNEEESGNENNGINSVYRS